MAQNVKLNLSGINAVMTSPAAQALVDRLGKQVASDAGDGFEYVPRPHRYTARGYVQTGDARARRRQAKEAALEGALGRVQR